MWLSINPQKSLFFLLFREKHLIAKQKCKCDTATNLVAFLGSDWPSKVALYVFSAEHAFKAEFLALFDGGEFLQV